MNNKIIDDCSDNTNISIDVGGGTSDIVIRYNEKCLLYSSVKLAGQDLTTDSEKNLPIIEFLFAEITKHEIYKNKGISIDIKGLRNTLRNIFNNKPQSYINSLFKEFKYCSDKTNFLNKIDFFKIIILYLYSSLFYEIGIKLRLRLTKGLIDKNTISKEIKVVFGGNASQLLKWLHNDETWKNEKVYLNLFSKVFSSALGLEKQIASIVLSDKPKQEVVLGLCLVKDSKWMNAEEAKKENVYQIGENIVYGKDNKFYRSDSDIQELLEKMKICDTEN